MSSMDIARLTGKKHHHVRRDIQVTLAQADISASKFGGTYLDTQGKRRPCYYLPRFECDLLLSGYDVVYRKAILIRWYELEAEVAARPKTRAELAYLQWQTELELEKAHQVTLAIAHHSTQQKLKIERRDALIAEIAPQAALFDAMLAGSGEMQIGEVSRCLQLPAGRNGLKQALREMGVLIRVGNSEVVAQKYIDAGWLRDRPYKVVDLEGNPVMRDGIQLVSNTPYFSLAGRKWLFRKYISNGIPNIPPTLEHRALLDAFEIYCAEKV